MTNHMARSAQRCDVDAYVTSLCAHAARASLRGLSTCMRRHALYVQTGRNGVDTLVLRTTDLTEEQLCVLLRYRLAHYLATGFVDARAAFDAHLAHESRALVADTDLHVVACTADRGELLCYATLKAAVPGAAAITLRDRDRPLLPVEAVHGWGIFNHLRGLPDLPMARLREVGRFVRNQRLPRRDERAARAAVEVCVALLRTLLDPLRSEVDALVGDLEDAVAGRHFALLHIPLAVVHGTHPSLPAGSYLGPRYQACTVHPFAALCADLSEATIARLEAIETALAAPGITGLHALFALKRRSACPPSSLVPG